jgi:hypothetical protein
MTDFAVNYQAGLRLAAGETLYQTADGHYMFKYLPSAALLYWPLAALPLEIAKAIWFVMSVAALFATFHLVRQLVPLPHVRFLTLLPALVLAKYFLHELRLGQINILVTLVMLLGIRALTRPDVRDRMIAGAYIGTAVALKPYAALFIPYFVVQRQLSSLLAATAVLVAALAIPSIFYGFEGNLTVLRQWADTLRQSTPTLLTNIDNVSVFAFAAKWTGDPARAQAIGAVVVAGLALLTLIVIVRGRRRAAELLDGALILTLIPLVSPLGWDYTLLMSFLAVSLLINHFGKFPRAAQAALAVNFAIIALAVYDVMGRQAYGTFMQWSITTVNFLLVVAALVYLRFKGAC